ncbi:MAG: STAS domain-containing protein [Lishizhenia sp.]
MQFISKIEKHPVGVTSFFFEGKILLDKDFDSVQDQINKEITAGERMFIFNLNKLEYINSSGLNLFLKLYTKIRANGGELVLCEISKGVEKLFHISKLDSIFNICASNDEALNYLNANKA